MRQLLLALAERGKDSDRGPATSFRSWRGFVIKRRNIHAQAAARTALWLNRQAFESQRTMGGSVGRGGPDAVVQIVEIIRAHIEPGMEVTPATAESAVRFRTAKGEKGTGGDSSLLWPRAVLAHSVREVQTRLGRSIMTVARSGRR